MPDLNRIILLHAAYYMSVLQEANRLYTLDAEGLGRALELFDANWQNIRLGQSRAAQMAGGSEAAARFCTVYCAAGAHPLQLRLHPREQISWIEAALNSARIVGDLEAEEAVLLGNLGLAHADLGDYRQAMQHYEEALTKDSSLKLLAILVPLIVEQNHDECRELVRDLECLPLALHVAGRLLRSEAKLGWGVTDLIREIREGAKVIEAQAPIDRIDKDKVTIPTVSALLMKSTDMLDEFTRECFAYLAAFAPKPATFDLEALQAVWEVDDAKPIVRKLAGHGLLEPSGDGRFQMHRILVDHARSLCEE